MLFVVNVIKYTFVINHKKTCLRFRIYIFNFLCAFQLSVLIPRYNNGKSVHVFKVGLGDYVADI